MIFKIFVFFKIYATVLPKNNPKPFFLSKCIDFDSFSWQNNENSPNSKNCPKLRGLLPVALEILPKTEHGKFLCLLYRFIFHCQFAAVSPRKKVRQYGVKFYRVHCTKYLRNPFPTTVLTRPRDKCFLAIKQSLNFRNSSQFCRACLICQALHFQKSKIYSFSGFTRRNNFILLYTLEI